MTLNEITKRRPLQPVLRFARLAPLLLPLTMAAAPENLQAQAGRNEIEDTSIHWAFASLVGTGWYRMEDGQHAFVLNIPPGQEIRQSNPDSGGFDRVGIYIKYDTAIGLYAIDDIPGIIEPENLSMATFTPGVELEIPVTSRWYLRPFAHLGWGTALDSGNSAWIYYAGIKSRYVFGRGDPSWTLYNSFYWAGYSPDSGPSNDLASLLTGIELGHRLGSITAPGEALKLYWRLGYTMMNDGPEFLTRSYETKSIGDTLEFGVALGRPDRPFRIWFLEFERFGLNYALNSDGTFKAITFNTTSWFTK
jgi:hypothetical protein